MNIYPPSTEKSYIEQHIRKVATGKRVQKKYTKGEKNSHDNALAVIKYILCTVLGWNADEIYSMLTYDMLVDLKLRSDWEALDVPAGIRRAKDVRYIAALLEPRKYKQCFSEEVMWLTYYRTVIEKRGSSFSDSYFRTDGTRKACLFLRYILTEALEFDNLEQMYITFADPNKIIPKLRHYGLASPCKLLFSSPLEFLYMSLPKEQRSDWLVNFAAFNYQYGKYREQYKKEHPSKKVSP